MNKESMNTEQGSFGTPINRQLNANSGVGTQPMLYLVEDELGNIFLRLNEMETHLKEKLAKILGGELVAGQQDKTIDDSCYSTRITGKLAYIGHQLTTIEALIQRLDNLA